MISIITGCTRPHYLAELAASVAAQREPGGPEIEWVVQLDGADAAEQLAALPGDLTSAPWIHIAANDGQQGSAVTRNMALARSGGELVLCVDDDDLLVAGALPELARRLAEHPEAFAAAGACELMSEDSQRGESFKRWAVEGPVEVGAVGREFRDTGVIPVHVGACLWRRTALVAVGGYAALPRSIDTNPFVAAEAVHPLLATHVPTYRYREHGEQMTRGAWYEQVRGVVHGFTNERADAARELNRASEDR